MVVDRLPASGPRQTAGERYTLRKLAGTEVDPNSLTITLFRDVGGTARGWFVGPLAVAEGRTMLPYLAETENTLAAVAIVRAIEVAASVGCPVCVIDPADLWDHIWRV